MIRHPDGRPLSQAELDALTPEDKEAIVRAMLPATPRLIVFSIPPQIDNKQGNPYQVAICSCGERLPFRYSDAAGRYVPPVQHTWVKQGDQWFCGKEGHAPAGGETLRTYPPALTIRP